MTMSIFRQYMNRFDRRQCCLQHWRIRFALACCLSVLALFPFKGRALTPWALSINTNNLKVITDYGASTASSDNTTFIQNAIKAAAVGGVTNGLRGGVVQIPAGTFLCGPLNLSNNVRLQIDAGATLQLLPYGTYPGSPYTGTVLPFINGTGLTNIAITGLGTIDGQGAPWWQVYGTNASINRPLLVNFSGSSKVLLQDFSTTNPPVAHIVVKGANAGNISFVRIKLMAPDSGAPNTDGIDFAETNALFQDCFISTGDDNIAIGSSASTSKDMLVTNCIFGAGHGLSIGSYTSGGVSNLTVINCSFDGSGIRIKSSRDRGGVVQNLNYLNLTITNSDTPVNIYAYYEFGLGTLTTLTPQFVASYCLTNVNPSPYKPPIFRDILVSNLSATLTANVRNPFLVLGLPDYPVSNIVFKAMNITKPAGVNNPQIYNATNVSFTDCNWVLPSGDKIQFWNADVLFTNSVLSTNLLILDGITYSNIGNTLEFDNASATLANTNAIADGALTLAGSLFTVSNNLALTTDTPLNYVLGTNAAILAVTGNLTLGGIVNVAAGPSFTNGIYPLMTYAGELAGSLPVLGAVPSGYTCALSTATPGVVNLVVGIVPPAPANLMATASNAAVFLTWDAVSSAASYNVKRSTVSGGTYSVLTNLAVTNFTDASVVNGTTYYYVVSALNSSGESTNSIEVSATPTNGPSVWPSPWQTQDIGMVGVTGGAGYTNGVFTVSGAGADIYGTADAFRCVYLGATNDCTIIARVASIQNINAWSKAGVMIRESLATNAANAFVGITPGNGSTWQYRSATGGSTTYNSTAGINAPYWFKMVRSGNTFTGYRSADGTNWTQQGNATFAMSTNAFIGLAVTSHNSAALCTATFDNVTAPNWSSANPPPAPVFFTASPTNLQIHLRWTAVSGATNYNLKRGTASGTYATVFNGLTGTNFTDASVTNGITYYYAVSSLSAGGEGTNSVEASAIPLPSNQPTNITFQVSGNQMQLSWPPDHLGWRLLIQTNSLNSGLGTNWVTVPDSTNATSANLYMNTANGSVFLRLVYP